MTILVVGGSRSGKSAFAEQLVKQHTGPYWYVATMTATDAGSLGRIEAHREQRAGVGFETIECGPDLRRASDAICGAGSGGTALLDDIGNLVTGALFDEEWNLRDSEQVFQEAMAGVRALAAAVDCLIVVSDVVGCDGVRYDSGTQAFVELAGRINCAIAAEASDVYEVVAGCPVRVKGGEA